jgi:dTDP-4-dehydrorhamnose reductase
MKKLLVFGESGLIGSRFVELANSDFEIDAPSQEEVDLLREQQAASDYINGSHPDVILNFTGYTAVDKAEEEAGQPEGLVHKINVGIPEFLAGQAKKLDALLVHISTAYIFDGTKTGAPYKEEDEPHPLGWYGLTKLMAEDKIKESGVDNLILRIDMPYRTGYKAKTDFANYFVNQLKEGKEVEAINDGKITPIFIDHLVEAIKVMINKNTRGIYNVASTDSITLFEFVNLLAEIFGFDKELIKPISFEEYSQTRPAKRPQHTWYDVSKFINEFGEGILKSNGESLEDFRRQINF